MLRALALAALLVLAGCQAPTADGVAEGPATPDERDPTAESTATATAPANATDDATAPPDPETDRIGWEGGVWYNESLSVNNTDGLDERDLAALVNRSMARVERIRDREFESSVPVSVISRAEYRNRSTGETREGIRRFDNGKFEALFLIGEGEDSIQQQDAALGRSVLGYYSTRSEEIVVVADSETPQLDGEGTLAHELVHALQDQLFGLEGSVQTRDAYQGRNGLVEGDAASVEQRYTAKCGNEWDCLDRPDGDGGGGGAGHFGLNFLMYFPYSDGPGFVAHLREEGGWDAVDAAFADKPDGATEVIYPDLYPGWEPADVRLPDRSNAEWERVRPPGRPDYAVVGQSAIAASLAYTVTDDYNDSGVVRAPAVVNFEAAGQINRSDPYNYDVATANGWAGGKMVVYEHGEESAYVWRTEWTNESEAAEFAAGWAAVVRHWGGEQVSEDVWVIEPDSPFTDAVRIERSGSTVTVVNAPDREALGEVHDA